MNYVIVRNGIVVWEGNTLSDAQVFISSIQGNLSENDKIYLYQKSRTAVVHTTVTYS